MEWLWLTLMSAAGGAIGDAVNNHRAMRTPGAPLLAAWQMFLVAAPAFAALALIAPLPATPVFWVALLLTLPAEYLIQHTFFSALERSDSSKVLPLLGLTPLFLLASSPFTGEMPDWKGLVGVGCIIAGSLVVAGFAPNRAALAAMTSDSGARTMCLCALFCAWSSIGLGVMARSAGAPATVGWYYLAATLTMTPAAVRQSRSSGSRLVRFGRVELGAGLMFLLNLYGNAAALALAPAAYVAAVRRVGALFSVILGRIFFGEAHFTRRACGSLLIIAGVAAVALAGR